MNTIKTIAACAFPALDLFDHKAKTFTAPASHGMTLRDYFAAKAMQSLISCAENHGDIPHRDAAVDAYRYADAMLRERSS